MKDPAHGKAEEINLKNRQKIRELVTELLVSLRKLLNDQPELEAGSAICKPKIGSRWWTKKK